MPSKNEVKIYVKDCYYHIYNRGVEKRDIFLDDQDYSIFLSYLKTYLLPRDEKSLREKLANPKTTIAEKDKILKLIRLNNFSRTLELLAYCLMRNHFHLLVYQRSPDTIHKFMNSLITRYVMYFNRKYKRVGPLFQGVYKAVIVETDEQFLHLSRYIHLQAIVEIVDLQGQPLQVPLPSSYPNYLGKIFQEWVQPDRVLAFFNSSKLPTLKDINSYKSFVEYKNINSEVYVRNLLLE